MDSSAWQMATNFEIIRYDVEDEWLLFHTGNGSTHRLNGLYLLVFAVFWNNRAPVSLDALVSFTRQDADFEIYQIKQAVEALVELYLLKSVK